jgi:NPCBM/NEW2 domain/PA14 domain
MRRPRWQVRAAQMVLGLSVGLMGLTACSSPDAAPGPDAVADGKVENQPWSDRLPNAETGGNPYADGRQFPWTGATASGEGISAQALGNGVNYLSDLTWTSATNGYGPVEKDRSNGEAAAGDGKPLTIQGATFAKGLGVHANSTITYTLLSTCPTFSAQVGVDDEIGNLGSVIFQVYGDGVKLYDSGIMTGADAAKPISVNTAGKTELKLVVDANGSPDYDHADWADAKVSCTSQTPSGDQFVSDLSPSASSNGWGPIEKDKSNGGNQAGDGKTMSIRGVTFAKGLGVHANSSVSYQLNKSCSAFGAQVGLDDEVGGLGNVLFQVYGDGVKLYDSGAVTGKDPAKAVNVNLAGVSELRLVIDGNGSIDYDHADWGNATVKCTMGAVNPMNGLLGTYYDTLSFTGSSSIQTDNIIDKNFGANLPTTTNLNKEYSIRWTGQITPKYNENYSFFLTSTGGSHLIVNGRSVVNALMDHTLSTSSGVLQLKAGVPYDIRIDYFSNTTFGGSIKLEWSSVSQVRQVVPNSALTTKMADRERIFQVLSNLNLKTKYGIDFEISKLIATRDGDYTTFVYLDALNNLTYKGVYLNGVIIQLISMNYNTENGLYTFRNLLSDITIIKDDTHLNDFSLTQSNRENLIDLIQVFAVYEDRLNNSKKLTPISSSNISTLSLGSDLFDLKDKVFAWAGSIIDGVLKSPSVCSQCVTASDNYRGSVLQNLAVIKLFQSGFSRSKTCYKSTLTTYGALGQRLAVGIGAELVGFACIYGIEYGLGVALDLAYKDRADKWNLLLNCISSFCVIDFTVTPSLNKTALLGSFGVLQGTVTNLSRSSMMAYTLQMQSGSDPGLSVDTQSRLLSSGESADFSVLYLCPSKQTTLIGSVMTIPYASGASVPVKYTSIIVKCVAGDDYVKVKIGTAIATSNCTSFYDTCLNKAYYFDGTIAQSNNSSPLGVCAGVWPGVVDPIFNYFLNNHPDYLSVIAVQPGRYSAGVECYNDGAFVAAIYYGYFKAWWLLEKGIPLPPPT